VYNSHGKLRTIITTVVPVQKPSRVLSFTAVYGVYIAHLVVIVLRPFFVASYTVSNFRRRSENGVFDRLRSFTIRWNTAVIQSLPNESKTIKTVVYGRVWLTWVCGYFIIDSFGIAMGVKCVRGILFLKETIIFKRKKAFFYIDSVLVIEVNLDDSIPIWRDHLPMIFLSYMARSSFDDLFIIHGVTSWVHILTYIYISTLRCKRCSSLSPSFSSPSLSCSPHTRCTIRRFFGK
jgi:hypothetical protein